jgi:acetoin utilization deacetylase AcuC-like enzyme
VPLPAGCGDADYAAVFDRLLLPIARAFAPDLVLVSAGFDTHASDPIGGMRMTEAGFARLSGQVAAIADEHAGGKLVLVLEGGYDLEALAGSVAACVGVLGGAPVSGAPGHHESNPLIERVIERVAAAHRPSWTVR